MKRQIDKYNEMMEKAANTPGVSFYDMQVSSMCCIAENTAIIADALGSRQQDTDAVYLANRICEIAKKYTDGDMAMREIASLVVDILGGSCSDDFRRYFENRLEKTFNRP